jgi:hypothetical protein
MTDNSRSLPVRTAEPALWKLTAQATLLGLAGAVAMFATEMMLFPEMMRADAPVPFVSIVSAAGAGARDAVGSLLRPGG